MNYVSVHGQEIDEEYDGEEFEVREPLMVISVNVSYDRWDNPYDAVRYAWIISPRRFDRYKLVLANLRGVIVGAYRPTRWLPGTKDNFRQFVESPGYTEAPNRWGFEGDNAEPETWNYYVRKRVPERYRRKGSRSPVRYCDPG